MIEIKVSLGSNHYPIIIGDDILEHQKLSEYVGDRAVVITNETIADLYLHKLSIKQHILVPDGEQYKSREQLEKIYDFLLKNAYDRSTTLVALGGGVITDISGFVAATYQRGIRFINIPTSLLAQVDASVGGKTAINHALGKNMIGAFYQPSGVFIDTSTLATLPVREFAAGMAEVIKYGLIMDREFLQYIIHNLDEILAQDHKAIEHIIATSCRIKAQIVEKDEKELGVRAILNLGHTFGHAMEAVQRYQGLLHGEAVALGMLMAMHLSKTLGMAITAKDIDNIVELFSRFNLPTQLPNDIEIEAMKNAMLHDKKNLKGKQRFVVLENIGSAVVRDDIANESITEAIVAYR